MEENDLWKSIKMIVAYITNENSGRKNGIVIMVHEIFAQKKPEKKAQWLSTPCS